MRKYELIRFEKLKIIKIYISAFLMFIIMFIIQDRLGYSILKLVIYIILGFIIYLFLLKLLRIYNNDDIEFFMLLLPKSLQGLRKYLKLLL